MYYVYSRTSSTFHHSASTTYLVPAESLYVYSCFNLLQWPPPHTAEATRIRLECQNNLLTTAS